MDMMDCSDIRRFLHAYIDCEFDEREKIELELHLAQCAHCRQEVGYYKALRKQVRHTLQKESAPPQLRASVLQALDAQQEPFLGSFSFSLATTGAVLCALGIFLWAPSIQDNLQRTINPSKQASTGSASGVSPVSTQAASTHSESAETRTGRQAFNHKLVSLTNDVMAASQQHLSQDDDTSFTQRNLCAPHRRAMRAQRGGWLFSNALPTRAARRNQAGLLRANSIDDPRCDPPGGHPFLRQASFEQ